MNRDPEISASKVRGINTVGSTRVVNVIRAGWMHANSLNSGLKGERTVSGTCRECEKRASAETGARRDQLRARVERSVNSPGQDRGFSFLPGLAGREDNE